MCKWKHKKFNKLTREYGVNVKENVSKDDKNFNLEANKLPLKVINH